MEWISVQDRLPDKEETVLIYSEGDSVTAAFLYTDKYFGLRWFVNNFGDCKDAVLPDRVTHWMPLPKPPKDLK